MSLSFHSRHDLCIILFKDIQFFITIVYHIKIRKGKTFNTYLFDRSSAKRYLNTNELRSFRPFRRHERLSRKWCAVCSKSAFHGNALGSKPRPYVLPFPWPRRDFSLLTSRDRHIPTLAPAVQACFLCTVIFIFSFAEPREQSDITDPETVWRSERKRTVQQKIFMATRSIKLRRIYTPDGWFCQTLIPFKPAGFITPCE